ncbi:MAG TPA: PAS domain-containing protein, partial [Steroidobacteraceae bacterium]
MGGIGSWLSGIWAAVLNIRPVPLQFGKGNLLPGWEELTRSAGVRIWDWDVVNNTMQFSGDLAEIYGAELAAAGSNADSIMFSKVHPDDRKRYRTQFIRGLKGEAPLEIAYRLRESDGSVRPVQLRAEVFRNAQGRAIRVLGLTIDMTAQVEAATLLAQQAERQTQLLMRLKLATETAGITIWETDLKTGEFIHDDKFCELIGAPPAQPINAEQQIHPDDRATVVAASRAWLENPSRDAIFSTRHRSANPRPEPQYVQTHMRVYRDEGGIPTRAMGVTWDVTKEVLHAAELESKAAQEGALIERLSVTTKAAGIAPWEFDIESGNFSWHGPRPPCFGLDDVPLQDYFRALTGIVLPEDREILLSTATDAIANNLESYQYAFRVRGTDREIHHMQNYARVMRDAGGRVR